MSKHHVNIYDFDKTIYDGDCTLDFYIYCLKKHPYLVPLSFKSIFIGLLFILRIRKREQFKEAFYRSFLPYVNSTELTTSFWESHSHKIKSFYLSQKSPRDIIISASPRFILQHIADNLGFRLIASEVDPTSGRLLSKNCRGEEKVIVLKQSRLLSNQDIIKGFYSDSLHDAPLAALAIKKYRVRGNSVIESDFIHDSSLGLITPAFLRFIITGCVNTTVGISSALIYNIFVTPSISFIAGYITALIVGFFITSVFVFNDKTFSIIKFIKYCLGYVPNFLIQSVIITVLYRELNVNYVVSLCMAAIISIPITFIILKINVFNSTQQ